MASPSPAPAIHRSNSVPAAKSASTPDPQIETLYSLPYAKIVAFATSTSTNTTPSKNGSQIPPEAPGTLSWISRLERTIAFGALSIYRAPGSVAFLNCGTALRPILPKSQAWCVDGDSKFVLQIRPPQYWRIEVPHESPEEKLRLEELKKVFEEVLLFEKTPCPFQRDFTVELPEQTPIKYRPWKPVFREAEELPPCSPDSGYGQSNCGSPERVSHASGSPRQRERVPFESYHVDSDGSVGGLLAPLDRLEVRTIVANLESSFPPSDGEPESSNLASIPRPYTRFEDDSDSFSDATDDTGLTPRSHYQPSFEPFMSEVNTSGRPQALQSSGSLTAPPALSLAASPPSKQRAKSPLRHSTTIVDSDNGFSSSTESFHSVQSWHSPLAPPSPPASQPGSPISNYPYTHNNSIPPSHFDLNREAKEPTSLDKFPSFISSTPNGSSDATTASPNARRPTSAQASSSQTEETGTEVNTSSAPQRVIRHRATTSSNSRRRTLSPLPAAMNLFSPPQQRTRRLQTARHLPTAIIQKTFEILLSPPSHLFHLMLSIASKIAAGEWRGVLSGYGEAVHWDFEDEYAGQSWVDGDSGTRSRTQPTSSSSSSSVANWEVD